MKNQHIILVFLSILTGSALHAEILFQSGFEYVTQFKVGFPDNGFMHPHITSDFSNSQQAYYKEKCRYPASSRELKTQYYMEAGKRYPIINSEHPVLNPCVYHDGEPTPDGIGFVSRAGNQFMFNADENSIQNSWTIIHNLEPAFMSTKLGIPGQSLPVYTPSPKNHAFEFLAEKTDKSYRAHMIADTSYNYEGVGRLGIPFLGIGTWSDKNNGGKPLAMIRNNKDFTSSPSTYLSFTAKIYSADIIDIQSGARNEAGFGFKGYLQLFLEAEWGDENRVVDIYLTSNEIVSGDFTTYKWNWPIRGSVFDGGSEIVVTSASRIKALCGNVGVLPHTLSILPGQIKAPIIAQYEINLDKIFTCLSENGAFSKPMPKTAPVTSVLWAVEASGHDQTKASVLWASVEEMTLSK